MSRAIPDLTQGFTGVSLPKTGPRQMGTDADGRTSVITFLNMVTESIESMHDNQTNVRPDYLPTNGIWCYSAPDGTKTIYQFDGVHDVKLWEVSPGGIVTVVGPAISFSQTITESGNFVVPYDGYYRARVWGGGGAGGGAYSSSTAVGIAAAGGHSGGFVEGVVYLTAGQTVEVTIGASGVGVVDSDGGNGGSSSFASVSAPGGQGGEGYSGTTAGYYFVCNRLVPVTGSQPGFPGQDVYASTAGSISYIASGAGASSLVGSGGPGALGSGTSASHGTAATGYASGGGGAWFQSGTNNHMRGGNGSPGVVIVDFIGV